MLVFLCSSGALLSVGGGGGVVPSSVCTFFFFHPVDPVTGARAPCCVWGRETSTSNARSLTASRCLSPSLSPPQLERTRAVHVTSHPTNKRQALKGAWPVGGLNSRSLFMRHTHPRARLRGELGVFKSSTNILTFPDMPMPRWHIRVLRV